jgi:hypothetical protein
MKQHFNVKQGESIPLETLTRPILKRIKEVEQLVKGRCVKVWWFSNPSAETYLFGEFKHDNGDSTTVTISYYYPGIGFINQV